MVISSLPPAFRRMAAVARIIREIGQRRPKLLSGIGASTTSWQVFTQIEGPGDVRAKRATQ